MEFRSGLHFLGLSLCFLLIFPRLAFSDEMYPLPLSLALAFLYKGFLSDAECEHLKELARDSLEKSMVADNESGKSIESEVRTSSGTFLSKAQVSFSMLQLSFRIEPHCCSGLMDEVVAAIEQRIAAWTFLPVENGEAIQILRYELGQKYEPHYDYFHDKANQQLGGHRIATVLMYLSNVARGGETVFPDAEGKDSQPKPHDWSDCAKEGYAVNWIECDELTSYDLRTVKPEKGDALMFFSLHPDATTDPTSLHGSCPVIEGEKWSATKWIHVRSFEEAITQTEEGGCRDENENCEKWAKAGECKKNPQYMVGSDKFSGYCRKSCQVCSS
ncbi:Probable prolyl 4-hydroxylase 7 [Linum grandiflorum]